MVEQRRASILLGCCHWKSWPTAPVLNSAGATAESHCAWWPALRNQTPWRSRPVQGCLSGAAIECRKPGGSSPYRHQAPPSTAVENFHHRLTVATTSSGNPGARRWSMRLTSRYRYRPSHTGRPQASSSGAGKARGQNRHTDHTLLIVRAPSLQVGRGRQPSHRPLALPRRPYRARARCPQTPVVSATPIEGCYLLPSVAQGISWVCRRVGLRAIQGQDSPPSLSSP